MNRRWPLLWIIGLVVLTATVHWPSLQNGFIWDDDDHFTENPAMTSPDGLRQIWTTLAVSRYYPLTLTTFWVQQRLWGLNPMLHHAVNIVLHAASAVLIFALLRKLQVRGAWAAAAIWAVHPVMVESVAWATELKNTQSGVFFFLSLLLFLKSEERARYGWYVLALACAAAALLSKPSAVILPLVLLLCVWWQRRRIGWADLLRAVPFLALSAGMSLLTIAEQRGHIERGVQDWSLTSPERLIVAGKALWFYAVKLLWPVNLTFVYARWDNDVRSVGSWLPVLATLAIGVWLWSVRRHQWARVSLFGLGYFVIGLLPVLGFYDVYYFRYSFVADHFQYLAAVGIIALASAGVAAAVSNRTAQRVCFAGVVVALGVLSWRHAQVFYDDETLWRDTLAKNPRAFLAHNNLGAILNGKEKFPDAEAHLREALRLKPGFLEAHNNLGLTLVGLKRYPEAFDEFNKALAIRYNFSKTHYCLGMLYYRLKEFEKSEYHFRTAIFFDPNMTPAYYELGALLQEWGKRKEAVECYRMAIARRPNDAHTRNNLGMLLAQSGEIAEAAEQFRLALNANPNLAEIHSNLGIQLKLLGRYPEAIQHLRKAIELKPTLANAYLELGKALADNHQYAEAIQVFQRGLVVEPRHMVMGNEMAWLMATAPDPAVRNAPQAIQIGERLADLTKRQEPKPLETLAAAYAEAGRFEEAAATAREALSLAKAQQLETLAANIQSRLALYENHQPYRSPSP